eukprot:1413983-Amphidinium_carterae.1
MCIRDRALDAALAASVAPSGLPRSHTPRCSHCVGWPCMRSVRPDEVLDFSVANAEVTHTHTCVHALCAAARCMSMRLYEVEQQLADLTKNVEQLGQGLKATELILLAARVVQLRVSNPIIEVTRRVANCSQCFCGSDISDKEAPLSSRTTDIDGDCAWLGLGTPWLAQWTLRHGAYDKCCCCPSCASEAKFHVWT